MEPLHGEYSFRRDIEKQIIGRIHCIKQTSDSNVYRLVIKNTIEEQLYVDL
jgi:SNF2 family DNA or RNA helicase